MEAEQRASPSVNDYTVREEIANAATHGLGFVLAVAGTAVLAASAVGTVSRWSTAVFGITLILLYGASTLYHAISHAAAKRALRILDHAAIYALIAGTYTPILLLGVGGRWGIGLLLVVWSLAVVGIVLSLVSVRRFKVLCMVLYLGMGWLVVVAGHRVLADLDILSIGLVLGGGLAYTGGLAFYAWRNLPYGHSVWHLFVLAGSALHYSAVMHML